MIKDSSQRGMAPLAMVLAVVVLGALGMGAWYLTMDKSSEVIVTPTPVMSPLPAVTSDSNNPEVSTPVVEGNDAGIAPVVKEFVMTSYYASVDGKPATYFSLKEMKVKKGDTVRVKVTNTKGSHDFSLDEYAIKTVTPLNEEVVIEFKADKVGTFLYYCSVPGHRALGQEGKLIVEE